MIPRALEPQGTSHLNGATLEKTDCGWTIDDVNRVDVCIATCDLSFPIPSMSL